MISYSTQPKVEFRKKPRAIESGLQQRIVGLWRNIALKDHHEALWAIPNSADVTEGNRMRLIAEGMLPGQVDLCLECMDGRVVWIEVKRPKTFVWSATSNKMIVSDAGGTLSAVQKEVHASKMRRGHPVYVIQSEKELLDIINKHAKELLKCQS